MTGKKDGRDDKRKNGRDDKRKNGRDDRKKKTVEMTGKKDSENYRITKLQLQLGFLGKIDKKI